MKKESHISSNSGFSERANVQYKKESEITTFRAKSSTTSSSDPYPPTTIRVTRNTKSELKYSVTFSVNIPKIIREEKNCRINRQIAGNTIETASTKND